MKKLLMLTILMMSLTSCGYSARNAELIGQPKKVMDRTPIIFPDYKLVDISLGVIRNGVGSMSSEDVYVVITPDQEKMISQAIESGQLVKVEYDNLRWTLRYDTEKIATSVEIAK